MPIWSGIQDRPSRRKNSRPDPSSPPLKPRAIISGAVLDLRFSLKLTVSEPRLIEEPSNNAKQSQTQTRARRERNNLTRAYLAGLESETPTFDTERCQPQADARSERNDLTRSCPSGLESKIGRQGPHPQTQELTSRSKLSAPETKSNNIGGGLGSKTATRGRV
ncbi:hypothetical protein DFP72DRAFT_1067774 [Ephemerocybe angulata]|uniref:Uncharacterized protein n=1 Tax=Ephemerocybe angulata TaxID=980116 RepID=A0A8H6I042_9AGAR|nr:hypothetical protein DFP72DRAFT_1067774 [Tulosesus angulatus]